MKFPIQALYDFYRNAIRNTKYRWWIILGTLVYLLSPLDISPDFLPIVGEIDDFILVTLMMSEVSQMLWERINKRPEETVQTATENNAGVNVVDVNAIPVK